VEGERQPHVAAGTVEHDGAVAERARPGRGRDADRDRLMLARGERERAGRTSTSKRSIAELSKPVANVMRVTATLVTVRVTVIGSVACPRLIDGRLRSRGATAAGAPSTEPGSIPWIAAGDQVGCAWVSSAPAPATCGAAIEAPESTAKRSCGSKPSDAK
jgi:hypothetical protein